MLDWIEHMDQVALLWINAKHTEWLDTFMIFVTNKFTWIPFYVLLLFLMWKQYRSKIYWLIACVFALILFADQGSNLMKDSFKRYRPCHNIDLQSKVHLVNNKCGGKFGFVSAHAANSMALALFVVLMLRKKYAVLVPIMISYTLLISYSRIYLAQHYPLDILGGWMLGILVALLVYRLFSRYSLFSNQSI